MEAIFLNDEDNDPPNSKTIPCDALNVGLGDIGKIKFSGKLVGANRANNLAVLKVTMPKDIFKPIVVGESTIVEVGQKCYTIGSPNLNRHTFTADIISDTNRGGYFGDNRPTLREMIQIGATICPNNRLLLDYKGHMIDLNTGGTKSHLILLDGSQRMCTAVLSRFLPGEQWFPAAAFENECLPPECCGLRPPAHGLHPCSMRHAAFRRIEADPASRHFTGSVPAPGPHRYSMFRVVFNDIEEGLVRFHAIHPLIATKGTRVPGAQYRYAADYDDITLLPQTICTGLLDSGSWDKASSLCLCTITSVRGEFYTRIVESSEEKTASIADVLGKSLAKAFPGSLNLLRLAGKLNLVNTINPEVKERRWPRCFFCEASIAG
ncbi:hypothetical protein KSP39_PZI015131 [Platanthera zijinensis]|uniref:Uncharacterized protein n=1 Tax=Platanthera zijinensis TaxID=2320716 RepID=A0AAP0G2Y1_9ASPA